MDIALWLHGLVGHQSQWQNVSHFSLEAPNVVDKLRPLDSNTFIHNSNQTWWNNQTEYYAHPMHSIVAFKTYSVYIKPKRVLRLCPHSIM